MKPMTEELKSKIWESHAGTNVGRKTNWDEIYDTEEELISDLFHEKILTDEDTSLTYKICKGYEYIKGFRRYYKKANCLTEKQMQQLKRLAYEIAFHIYVGEI